MPAAAGEAHATSRSDDAASSACSFYVHLQLLLFHKKLPQLREESNAAAAAIHVPPPNLNLL